MPALKDIKKQFQTERIIVVADKDLNSGDNIAFNTALGDGYIYSKSVGCATKDFKSYVLNDEAYTWIGQDYKKKSRVVPVDIDVGKYANGKNKKRKLK